MKKRAVLVLLIALVAAACDPPTPAPRPDIPYDESAEAVIVSIETVSPSQPPEYRENEVPVCTVHGDGHVLWMNPLEGGGEQLLEGYVEKETLIDYLHFIADVGFFGWADQVSEGVLPPAGVDSYTIVAVNIAGASHTVKAYNGGLLGGFEEIIARCLELVTEPILVEPSAGWLKAFTTEPDPNRPSLCWPEEAPVRLADVAAAGQQWIEGPYATFVWSTIHESTLLPYYVEGGACLEEAPPGEAGIPYSLIFEVPGIHPGAPPAPEE